MKSKFYFLILCSIGVACSVKKSSIEQTSEIKTLSSPSKSASGEPFLFTDKDSTVYLSWIETSADKTILKFSSLQNNQWSEPMIIATGNTWFVNWADYPMIATNGKQFVAHFLDKSGEGTYAYDVKLTTSGDSGNKWTEPQVLHDDGKKVEHGFVIM